MNSVINVSTLKLQVAPKPKAQSPKPRSTLDLFTNTKYIDDAVLDCYESRISIPQWTTTKFVALKNIIKFEASGSYTHIFHKNGQTILASKTLKHFVDQIHPSLFFKSNRSNLVNIREVQALDHGNAQCIMLCNNLSANISRKNVRLLLDIMRVYSPT